MSNKDGDRTVEKADQDSLHVLPLATMPLKTPGLLNGVLVKNARLDSVLEVFRDKDAGSGQVGLDDLKEVFPSYKKELEEDQTVLNKLSTLRSFDVYSLRIHLRNLGVDVNSADALSLSDEKLAELAQAMQEFTRPLLSKLYGENFEGNSFAEAFEKMSLEERKQALKKMKTMSKDMKMDITDLPQFIEDCGDMYLSIAYFENSLMELVPDVKSLIEWMNEIATNSQLCQDKDVMKICQQTEKNLKIILNSIQKRLSYFRSSFVEFWGSVSAESYEELKKNLMASHTNLGAVLCGLTVKIELFNEKFPTRSGSLKNRAEFIRSDIAVGLSELAHEELATPLSISENAED